MCSMGGEQPLESYEFCNLGSINLDNDLIYDRENNDVNWKVFGDTIITGIRFLDNVIDVNEYVLPQFKEKVLGNRKIGLGVTGLAHLFIKLGIKYDSQEALNMIDKIFSYKKTVEEKYDTRLAEEKGNFLTWDESIYSKLNIPRRNATISTQAPTGSISTILNSVSYGVEPLFNIGYIRRIVGGDILEVDQLFKEKLHNIIQDEEKEKNILRQCIDKGTTNLPCVPIQLRELFRCANDIPYEWHIKIMAQLQKYYDNAISKTVNLSESATIDDVKNTYLLAYKNNCKGITVYRNNSRQNQTMQIGNKEKVKEGTLTDLPRGVVYEVDDSLIGKKRKLITGCGTLHVQAFFDPLTGNCMEVFLSKGSDGGCVSFINALSRMVSTALRSGTPIEYVIDQLNSIITCPSYAVRKATKHDTSQGNSCPNAIGYALQNMQQEVWDELEDDSEENEEKIITKNIKTNKNNIFTDEELKYKSEYGDISFVMQYQKCPQCGNKLSQIEGCYTCPQCSWSKC